MLKLLLLVAAFVITSFSAARSEERNLLTSSADTAKIRESLLMNRRWVPFPDYGDRQQWDRIVGRNKSSLIQRGERQLDYQWKVLKATDYLEYERSGERNIMQNPNSANTGALSDLVVAELAEGKGRFIDQIINGVFLQCERTSWVLSAHLPYQHSKRSLPDHTEQVIDLGSGDLGGLLAWTYYFLHTEFDKIDPIISKRLHKELYDRIIIPYRTEDRFWWMGFNMRSDGVVNNWNPWCNFNVLQTAMLLEDDPIQLSKDVYRTMLSTDKFINYVNSDGACEEGPSYWGHAAGKLYDYLKVLHLATGGEVSLFQHPLVRNMGEYMPRTYIGDDWVVNFADASAKFSSTAGLIYRYGKAVESDEMMRFGSFLVKSGKSSLSYGLDIFRTLESIVYDEELRAGETNYTTPAVVEYPQTQFYYIKNDTGYFLAAKGGHNAESHNHNDIGTFLLNYKNLPLLIDVGVGTYTRQTFGPDRYKIWTMLSKYHNLPSINGQEQQFGSEYRASDIRFDKAHNSLSIDISKAYSPLAEVDYWHRSYNLKKDGLTIKDDFSLSAQTQPNEIHFMLWGEIDISQRGKVLIKIRDTKAELLYDSKAFEAQLEAIELDDKRLSNVWGDKVFRLTLKATENKAKASYEYKISVK